MTDQHDTEHHDQVFFDTFMLILGALGVISFAILFLARGIHAETADVYALDNEYAQAEIEARIEPVGQVRRSGDPEVLVGGGQVMSAGGGAAATGNAMPSTAPEQPAAQVAAAEVDGAQTYNQACVACHGAGIAGAPATGDAGAWTDRIGQGMDVLYEHAIDGYQGSAGFMPPKGGNMSLSDEAVRAAVDYMVAQSS